MVPLISCHPGQGALRGLAPVGVFSGRIDTQGIGCDAHPSQVEPVRIPASQAGDVAGDQAVAVLRASVAQQAHFRRRRLKIRAPELLGKFGVACPNILPALTLKLIMPCALRLVNS